MRILLIEDDANKAEQIGNFVASILPDREMVVRRAFQSGLREAVLGAYGAILLDMTMPTYEVGPREPGGRERRYAGREILRQLERRSLRTPVIVITQYEQFEENGENVTLSELVSQLRNDYPAIFLGAVFYQASNTSWMDQLKSLLAPLGTKGD
ncbi:response regulator transcription factor [Tuwongella immobilis]|uniref:Response regulator receiver protein n=1 Tax=Tuwongella immobilis TaxID=692036 RepID=A0A6C2YTD8_9BACT|nr:response regulator transcription factor [Tuwongella immobilis]VIP04393.1 Response regulator receiver protein OS=Rhizobium sp. IRBG74 GN=BN877_I0441 PE=4 SV=1 [Tuwongella immobilis]VTS06148.1 Response regulator receiver protein OS=Rhizobium sp. IRBG74 GN=BN877_I0441 PE=4 SV=1 [Tuwongella immobilis]